MGNLIKKLIHQLFKKEEAMDEELCDVFCSNSSTAQCLTKDDIQGLRKSSTLAGNVKLLFSKFVPTPQKFSVILEGISHVGKFIIAIEAGAVILLY